MSRAISVTVGPLAAASANNIATSQAGTANTKLTLTSSPFAMDLPRRVLITSSASDVAINFIIVGTDWSGLPVTDIVPGGAVTAVSAQDFSTVISVTPTGNTAGTVTVGTNATASSRPILIDSWGSAQITQQIVPVTGTPTGNVENTLDDFVGLFAPPVCTYQNASWVADAVLKTTLSPAAISNMASVPLFTRVTVTNVATTVRYTVIQPDAPSV